MKNQPLIKKNFIMNAILTMSSFVFPLISFPYISRILQPEGTGRVSFASALISYFLLFSQLGIPTYGIRACARVRDDREELTRTAHELLIINLIMDIVTYGALILALIYIPRLKRDRDLYVVISFTIILSSIGMEWLYKALEQYTYITIRSIVVKIIALCGMFLLVHSKEDYIIYGALTIFASSASNVLNFINIHKYIDLKPIGNYALKKHIRPVLVFFAISCATTIYTNIDTVMLGFMKNDEEVGLYNAAVKIRNVLLSMVTSLGVVLLPRVSYVVKNHHIDEFYRIIKKAIRFVIFVSIPITLFFILFAKEGILVVSGEAYLNAAVSMRIIMPTLLIVGVSNITGIQILVPLEREKIVLYSGVTGAITDLALNAILIPRYASMGAAIGTMVAEIVVLSFQCVSLRGDSAWLFKNLSLGNTLFSAIVSLTFCIPLKFMIGNHFIKLTISATLFFLVYFGVLLIRKDSFTRELLELAKDRLEVLHR